MKFETQMTLLDRACTAYAQGDVMNAQLTAMPVIHEMNRELIAATRKNPLPSLKYTRHFLNLNDYLTVLRAPAISSSELNSVSVLSWNMHFGADDSYTLTGWLLRHGKQYGVSDHQADPKAVRALAFLSATVARKMSSPADSRLVVNVPSSTHSTNKLPRQLAELISETSSRYDLTHPTALRRCRDVYPMKHINNVDEKMKMVNGSMVADVEQFRGRQVLLIDDLLGAGGTLKESARALKAAGASEVHALVLAKTRKFAREVMCN